MKNGVGLFVHDVTDLGHRKEDSGFVVRQHHGDERRVRSQRRAQIIKIQFALTDRGELSRERFGEGTKEEVVAFAYPLLENVLDDAYRGEDYENYESLPPNRRAAIARAVEQERSRLDLDVVREQRPAT